MPSLKTLFLSILLAWPWPLPAAVQGPLGPQGLGPQGTEGRPNRALKTQPGARRKNR
jgi:hypothetical protein